MSEKRRLAKNPPKKSTYCRSKWQFLRENKMENFFERPFLRGNEETTFFGTISEKKTRKNWIR